MSCTCENVIGTVNVEDAASFKLQTALQQIRAPQAWRIHRGDPSVRVAVIDTGIDYRHKDLRKNILWDGKRPVGRSFFDSSKTPDDDHSHGTHVAGIIGAVGNNRRGIAGVSWRVSLIPIKAFDKDGFGSAFRMASAICFAIRNRADVILCSWGASADSACLRRAVKLAGRRGIAVVAAAGNAALDLDKDPHYPAAYDFDHVISVGGCDENDHPVFEWGRGQQRVHLTAPGRRVLSTAPTRFRPFMPLGRNSGTSPAAAFVAGACALLKSYARSKGIDLTPPEMRDILMATADKNPRLASVCRSGGRLNLERALGELASRVQ